MKSRRCSRMRCCRAVSPLASVGPSGSSETVPPSFAMRRTVALQRTRIQTPVRSACRDTPFEQVFEMVGGGGLSSYTCSIEHLIDCLTSRTVGSDCRWPALQLDPNLIQQLRPA